MRKTSSMLTGRSGVTPAMMTTQGDALHVMSYSLGMISSTLRTPSHPCVHVAVTDTQLRAKTVLIFFSQRR
jgi:hypothetical protein